nr:hypothetical protein BaRGS_028612 [Batillaria attramentaria]
MDKDQQHVCIIQDYCDGGTLADRIQDAASWFIQIVMAVQYIHSQKVLHRDLKTENVFLTKKNVVKIGDFGISKILDSTIDVAKTVVGTPSYLSPELCQDIPYNSKSDVWPVPSHYSAGIHEIVNKILVKAPEDRPSAILNMPFVKDHLASFIMETESLRKQRVANNTSCQNQSEETDANSEYSDDFDASSDSEIEEDIQADKEGNASAAMSEEEPQYADDFEEYDSSEELEEVLTQAREAQELMPADDYFEESIEESDDLAQTLTENSFIKS